MWFLLMFLYCLLITAIPMLFTIWLFFYRRGRSLMYKFFAILILSIMIVPFLFGFGIVNSTASIAAIVFGSMAVYMLLVMLGIFVWGFLFLWFQIFFMLIGKSKNSPVMWIWNLLVRNYDKFKQRDDGRFFP